MNFENLAKVVGIGELSFTAEVSNEEFEILLGKVDGKKWLEFTGDVWGGMFDWSPFEGCLIGDDYIFDKDLGL